MISSLGVYPLLTKNREVEPLVGCRKDIRPWEGSALGVGGLGGWDEGEIPEEAFRAKNPGNFHWVLQGLNLRAAGGGSAASQPASLPSLGKVLPSPSYSGDSRLGARVEDDASVGGWRAADEQHRISRPTRPLCVPAASRSHAGAGTPRLGKAARPRRPPPPRALVAESHAWEKRCPPLVAAPLPSPTPPARGVASYFPAAPASTCQPAFFPSPTHLYTPLRPTLTQHPFTTHPFHHCVVA